VIDLSAIPCFERPCHKVRDHGARTSVTVTHHHDASPERVFDAWLDPEATGKWFFTFGLPYMAYYEDEAAEHEGPGENSARRQ